MIHIAFIRKCKNPERFNLSYKSCFVKKFTTIEEAIKFIKISHKNLYIYNNDMTLQQSRIFLSKLNAVIPEYESINDGYREYIHSNHLV